MTIEGLDGLSTQSESLETKTKMITSVPVLTRVFEHFNLAKDEDYQTSTPLDLLRKQIVVKVIPKTFLVDVSVKNKDPQKAADMANYLVKAYHEVSADRLSSQSSHALTQMKKEMDRLTVERQNATEELQAFKKQHGISTIDMARQVRIERLKALEISFVKVQSDFAKAKTAYDAVHDALKTNGKLDEDVKEIVQVFVKTNKDQSTDWNEDVVSLVQANYELSLRQMQLVDAKRAEAEVALQEIEILADQYRLLEDRLWAVENTYRTIVNGVSKLELESNISDVLRMETQVVYPADVPQKRAYPQRTKIVAVAFLGSAVLAVLLAILLEFMDKTVKRREEVENLTELPVYGMIADDKNKCSEATAYDNPKGVQSEAFRDLCTTLSLTEKGNQQMIAVTSPVKNDGKSFVSLNMAVTYARAGKKVLLIDTDMRSHEFERIWNNGQRPNKGLSDFLQGNVSVGEVAEHVLKPFKDLSMDVLFSGSEIDIPANLLGSEKFSDLLRELKGHYDTIILDLPAILSAADTRAMAAIEDLGFLLVVRMKSTEKNKLQMAVGLMKLVNANLLGTVLNGIENARDDSTVGSYGNDDEASNGLIKKIRKVIK